MTDITALARKAVVLPSETDTSLDGFKRVSQEKQLAIMEFRNAATPAAWIDLAERLEKAEARET